MQTLTSKSTAVNTKAKKLPALFKKIDIDPKDEVVDYGSGGNPLSREYVEKIGATYFPYDPYNEDGKVNAHTNYVLSLGTDVFVCSNVLNVIDDDDTIRQIIALAYWGSYAYFFSVYEGDRSGCGRQTGADQWQRNETIQKYMRFFREFDRNAVVYKGIITNRKEMIL